MDGGGWRWARDGGGVSVNPVRRTWAESSGEGSGESPEHSVGLVNDIAIRELINPEPVVDECVHSGGVACDLLRCAVEPLTQGLDDDVGPWKSEVDADDSVAGASEDLLCVGPRERCGFDKSKKLSFEPAPPRPNSNELIALSSLGIPYLPCAASATVRRCTSRSLNLPSRRPELYAATSRSGGSVRARSTTVLAPLVTASSATLLRSMSGSAAVVWIR
jgi:hypothetical protein